jgi:tRNA G10  N-methylase Trm11
MDSISGRIARTLYPDHDIRIENFRDTQLPEDRIDAVIGNVPFADLKLDYHGQKLSLHDYFFAKSIDALKPGGILAMVTTHFTLDKLCGRPHNLCFVVLSVMWRPMATFKAHSRLGILNAT